MIPTLVKPKLLSIKNRWRIRTGLRSQLGRDAVLGIFSVGVMLSIYYGLIFSLAELQSNRGLVYLHPSLILGLVLVFLFGLLLFSNSVSALGSLFLASDLDLILASPTSRRSFCLGKLLETIGSSTWMVVVFGLPVIAGFVTFYKAPPLFFFAATIAVLVPYFIIPSAVAIILVTLFTTIVPASRTKEILVIAGAVAILALYFVIKLVFPEDLGGTANINDFLQVLTLLRLPNTHWNPASWAATSLGELLEPSGKNLGSYIGMLYSSAFALCCAAYIVVSLLHRRAYSQAKSGTQSLHLNSRRRQRFLTMLTPYLRPEYRAILGKEISVFLRDMSQAVQLMMLLGLCTIYLYNLKVLRVVQELPQETRIWWQAFLVIGNMAMGAFVIAAVCTRFVFPSISLEGRAYWSLRSSPIPLSTILRAKFWTWYIPVATIGSVLLTSGAFAIQAESHIVIVSGFISWILCYGIVGLGIGLGAVYANFDWEHSSQLAASFGSLIYMITSTAFISVNLIPTTVIILMRSLRSLDHQISQLEWYVSIASCALLLTYINYAVANWALKLGENSLMERERA